MIVSEEKRNEYWNHFVERYFVFGEGGGHGVTGSRLRKIKKIIMVDNGFWVEVIIRHDGADRAPELMKLFSPETYSHCQGNFWGMIMQTMIETRVINTA